MACIRVGAQPRAQQQPWPTAYQEYISIESMQLPETAFLHIDVTSNSANPISGGVVV